MDDLNMQSEDQILSKARNDMGAKYVVVMVGLPARGKSYICKKLARYLQWAGFKVKIFNVGNKRRSKEPNLDSKSGIKQDSSFFDHSNRDAAAKREQMALECLGESIKWLLDGGKLAILDATNTTIERRKNLKNIVKQHQNIKCLFIESICLDKELLEANIKMKLQGPDYIGLDPDVAIHDFKQRISNYEKVYETISEEEEKQGYSYIKIIDVGSKIIANRIKGYLPSQCVFYLMQMHIVKRTMWLSLSGESEDFLQGKIGGNSSLTERGREYAEELFNFIDTQDRCIEGRDFESSTLNINSRPKTRVLCSSLKRAIETAMPFEMGGYEVNSVRFLNEIYAGDFEGLKKSEIEEMYPKILKALKKDPLVYRYPGVGGESLIDVIERLKPVIIELERLRINLIAITHKVVMKTLLAYFSGLDLTEMAKIEVPPGTVFKLEPTPYGANIVRYTYDYNLQKFVKAGEGLAQLFDTNK